MEVGRGRRLGREGEGGAEGGGREEVAGGTFCRRRRRRFGESGGGEKASQSFGGLGGKKHIFDLRFKLIHKMTLV